MFQEYFNIIITELVLEIMLIYQNRTVTKDFYIVTNLITLIKTLKYII